MDSIRQSIIEKRNRLGWTNKTLAEKSNVPLIIIDRFLDGSFCLSCYISQIKSSLNQALHSDYLEDENRNTNTPRVIPKKINKSIIERRKKFKWTTRELAAKANIPFKTLLNIEKGVCCWPEDLIRLEKVLEITLVDRKKEKYQSTEDFSDINNNPITRSKYFIDTSDIDLKLYFPNLSRGEERILFGYSKEDRKENRDERQKVIYPKIKFKSTDSEGRLDAALEHCKILEATFPKRKWKIRKDGFTPNFNPIACEWFEKFDKANNTVGFYATTKGEYYIEELGYFPDYFNTDLKLIMEWDELYHYTEDGELSAKDKKRQKEIQDLFPDFKFIRIKEEDFKEYLEL